MKLKEEIYFDLEPLFHRMDIYGEDLTGDINAYLENGTTSFGSVIPNNIKEQILKGTF